MGYEPKLVIRKSDLMENVDSLESRMCTEIDEDQIRVLKFLVDVSKYEAFEFDGIELILCHPELTSFNRDVRDELIDLEIDYRTIS